MTWKNECIWEWMTHGSNNWHTFVRASGMWHRGISRLDLRHLVGTWGKAHSPSVHEALDPAYSNAAQHNRHRNKSEQSHPKEITLQIVCVFPHLVLSQFPKILKLIILLIVNVLFFWSHNWFLAIIFVLPKQWFCKLAQLNKACINVV